MTSIAFLGLGAMGRRMVRRIAAARGLGHENITAVAKSYR